jgi:hypothetical protein
VTTPRQAHGLSDPPRALTHTASRRRAATTLLAALIPAASVFLVRPRHWEAAELDGASPCATRAASQLAANPLDGLLEPGMASHIFGLTVEGILEHLELPSDVLATVQGQGIALRERIEFARERFDALLSMHAEEALRIARASGATGAFVLQDAPPGGAPFTTVLGPEGAGYLLDSEHPDLAFLSARIRQAPLELRDELIGWADATSRTSPP